MNRSDSEINRNVVFIFSPIEKFVSRNSSSLSLRLINLQIVVNRTLKRYPAVAAAEAIEHFVIDGGARRDDALRHRTLLRPLILRFFERFRIARRYSACDVELPADRTGAGRVGWVKLGRKSLPRICGHVVALVIPRVPRQGVATGGHNRGSEQSDRRLGLPD